MALCIAAGAKTLTLATAAFTLSWTHSVEKTRWEESWRVLPEGLLVAEARVQGSGAGMEPPEGAVLENGWWTYKPDMGPIPELVLAASGATHGGWRLCAGEDCHVLGATSGEPVTIRSCQP